jgi:fructose-bisphosphate aldolase class II
MLGSPLDKPIFLVMHGGSGSTDEEIAMAVKNGVVKMNIDTDTQWAYWDGLREFEKDKHDYLQAQIGNPTGADKPNKKFYDPRVWIRKAEEAMSKRVGVSMEKLNSIGTYPASDKPASSQLGELKQSLISPALALSAGIAIGAVASALLKMK